MEYIEAFLKKINKGGEMGSSVLSKQFELIQQDRRGVVQSSVYPGIKELVSEIYPEEAHFIYELLQNAEDANASSVYFEIQKTQLVFKHNGTKMFDADDIDSITNIAKSTKKDNYVQAGKFGIGFKSVYAFTDTPSIYCDTVCFRIDQLLLPVQIEDIRTRKAGWTEFRFPFNSPKINAIDARNKIRQGLIEIESTTLLFLNNITRLDYKLVDGSSYCVKKEVNGRFVTCTTTKNKSPFRQKNSWMRFSKLSSLNGKSVWVDVAFPMFYKEKEKVYDFINGEDKVCIKFLAKNEKSNLRFYINAPFGCTPARDTVNKEDRLNKELVREIASLMTATIIELRDIGYLTDGFFEILPLKEDNVPEFYQPIVDAIKKSFVFKENLPTMVEGKYVTTGNGIMSSRNVIDKIFTQDDIRTLYQNDWLCFVKNRQVNSRAYKFLKSLEIKELSPDSVLKQMTNIGDRALIYWLKNRSDEKLVEIYAYLSKGIDNLEHQAEKYEDYEEYVTDSWYSYRATVEQITLGKQYLYLKDLIQRIKRIPIVKITDGSFTVASDAYLVEEGVDVPKEFKTVLKGLYKNDQAMRFLKAMGVKTFTQEELRGYQYKNEIEAMKTYLSSLWNIDVRKTVEPLELARKIISFLKKHHIDEINWNDYCIVYAKHTERHSSSWQRVTACCLDKPIIGETGLSDAVNIHKKCIVDGIYNDLKEEEKNRWIDFLKANGVLWEIRVKKIDGETGYVTGTNTDYEILYLKQYLELHSISLARYIWKSLCSERGWSYSYGKKYFKLNKNYAGRSEDSTALSLLKKINWVPDRNGVFHLPRDLSRNTIDSSFVIDESNGFLSAIEFGANSKKREEEEKARKEKESLKKAQQIKAARLLGFASTEAVLASKEDSKKIAKLRELGLDIDELISAEEKKKRAKQRKNIASLMSDRQNEAFIEARSSDYDLAAVVVNPDRSKRKAEADLDEEPADRKKKVIVRKEIVPNKEEKQFLYNQYSGKCQVCSKTIVKKDGSYYFEAINLMNTAVLEEKYLTGLNLGWNTLCLCPNCAAEYQHGAVSLYDFKDKVLGLRIDKSVDDYIEFPIKMQGEDRILRYSPVHLFNLQIALNHFSGVSLETIDMAEDTAQLKKLQNSSATLIKKLESGDKCPDCGKRNNESTTIIVIDRNGKSQRITGLQCQCGTKYLTRKLFKKMTNPSLYNIVLADSSQIKSIQEIKKNEPIVQDNSISNTGVNSISLKQEDSNEIDKCNRCGALGTVFSSGLCWNCYKDELQSIYD